MKNKVFKCLITTVLAVAMSFTSLLLSADTTEVLAAGKSAGEKITTTVTPAPAATNTPTPAAANTLTPAATNTLTPAITNTPAPEAGSDSTSFSLGDIMKFYDFLWKIALGRDAEKSVTFTGTVIDIRYQEPLFGYTVVTVRAFNSWSIACYGVDVSGIEVGDRLTVTGRLTVNDGQYEFFTEDFIKSLEEKESETVPTPAVAPAPTASPTPTPTPTPEPEKDENESYWDQYWDFWGFGNRWPW